MDHFNFRNKVVDAWKNVCMEIMDRTKKEFESNADRSKKEEDLNFYLIGGKWTESPLCADLIFIYPLMCFELRREVDGVLVSKRIEIRLEELKEHNIFNEEVEVFADTIILDQSFTKREKYIYLIGEKEDAVPEQYNGVITVYPKIDYLSQHICEFLKFSDESDDKSILNVIKRASETGDFSIVSESDINSLQIEKGWWDGPEGRETRGIKVWGSGQISRFGRRQRGFASRLEDYCNFYIKTSRSVYCFFSKNKVLNAAVLSREGGGVTIFRFYLFYLDNEPLYNMFSSEAGMISSFSMYCCGEKEDNFRFLETISKSNARDFCKKITGIMEDVLKTANTAEFNLKYPRLRPHTKLFTVYSAAKSYLTQNGVTDRSLKFDYSAAIQDVARRIESEIKNKSNGWVSDNKFQKFRVSGINTEDNGKNTYDDRNVVSVRAFVDYGTENRQTTTTGSVERDILTGEKKCIFICFFSDGKLNYFTLFANNEYKNLFYVLRYEFDPQSSSSSESGIVLIEKNEIKSQSRLEKITDSIFCYADNVLNPQPKESPPLSLLSLLTLQQIAREIKNKLLISKPKNFESKMHDPEATEEIPETLTSSYSRINTIPLLLQRIDQHLSALLLFHDDDEHSLLLLPR